MRVARQIYICLWVLYVWGRDVGNVEASYRASELAILCIWELVKPLIDKPSREHRALETVIDQTVRLHLLIATGFIEKKIAPLCSSRDAVGMTVGSRSAVDVSLKLFDLLGRVALTGVWLKWLEGQTKGEESSESEKAVRRYFEIGMSLIENNRALNLPLCDDQTTDISLFLLLCLWHPEAPQRLVAWLESMVSLHDFTVRANGRYPTSLREYTDLVEHPREQSKDYFEEATAGSTLIPVLAMWSKALGRPDLSTRLARLTTDKLGHCTMQLWVPGKDTEQHLYVNSNVHGLAITDLPISDGCADLAETVTDGCKEGSAWAGLPSIPSGAA